jgi:uroporphyrinogen III methyltransferase/synthase
MQEDYGIVYLVGAGPGDPGLITMRAVELLNTADVVVYDYLVNKRILQHASEETEIIYAGKSSGDHTKTQDQINRLIADKAKDGLDVVRLKGGDPFVFGRGSEEARYLLNEGVEFEIVPGVTSAIAAPAYAGIPLTTRGISSSLQIITGNEDPEKDNSHIDWKVLGKSPGTLVFLMGVKNLEKISTQLVINGKSSDTPAALVRWGTTTRQRTLVSTLQNVAEDALKANFQPPCVIVVGDVVNLRSELSWFEERPLFGKKIVVTRSRAQASALTEALEYMGAEVIETPTIEIKENTVDKNIDATIKEISSFDWVIFTSVNGVNIFFDRLFGMGLDTRQLAGVKVAAIGSATEELLAEVGICPDVVPEKFVAESLAKELGDLKGKKVLLPVAKGARTVLSEKITKAGGKPVTIHTYETVAVKENDQHALDVLNYEKIDMITFACSSTVKNFVDQVGVDYFKNDIPLLSIGPVTSSTIKDLKIGKPITASEHNIPGMIDKILDYFEEK